MVGTGIDVLPQVKLEHITNMVGNTIDNYIFASIIVFE